MSARGPRIVVAVVVLALAVTGGWCAFGWSRASMATGTTASPVSGLTALHNDGWHGQPGAAEFVVAQSVLNTGRVDATVTGITTHPGDPFQVEASYLPSDPRGGGVEPGATGRPFPVRLKRGQEIHVLIRYRQRRCFPMAAGSSLIFDRIELRYRVYGVGRKADVRFGSPLTVSADAVRRNPVCG